MLKEFWEPIQLSISITLTAGLIVVIIGTVIGWLFATKTFKGKVFGNLSDVAASFTAFRYRVYINYHFW